MFFSELIAMRNERNIELLKEFWLLWVFVFLQIYRSYNRSEKIKNSNPDSIGEFSKKHRAGKFRIEAPVGFEPTNKGFADLPLKPLGYSAL